MNKKNFGLFIVTFIYCFIFWMLLTWSVEVKELVFGLIVCIPSAWFGSSFFVQDNGHISKWLNPIRWIKLLYYIVVVFGWELIKANVAMARNVLFNEPLKQAVIKVPVNGIEDTYGLAMLSNCITLTPGTITMDVAEDPADGKTCLYVQWLIMESDDSVKAGEIIKGKMEKYIRGIFS